MWHTGLTVLLKPALDPTGAHCVLPQRRRRIIFIGREDPDVHDVRAHWFMASQFNILGDGAANAPSCGGSVPSAEIHPRPAWLKVRFFGGENYQDLKRIMRGLGLHTVCESARCPNQGECWEHRTATFMILGDICTRACGFCAVTSGRPAGPPDEDEPERVAQAVEQMRLKYAVVTSVNRDDQPDGGAKIFARTIGAIRARVPECKVEVLIPDFRGDSAALEIVVAAGPDVLNHNVETVPRLYSHVRPGAIYGRSLELLGRAKKLAPDMPVKTGMMLGLGESVMKCCERWATSWRKESTS